MGAGVYVMIGLFALGFNTADQAVYNVAKSQAYHDQARQIAQAGVKFAVGDVGSNSSASFPSSTVNLIGGTVSYAGDRPAGLIWSQMRIISSGTYNGFHVTSVAILQFNGTKWVIQRVYQLPDAAEYARMS
jgi:hypothetical protein